jgi:hypothetical protein
MSKASAGKVYFVLYLAVILELLIIIVERDEAEEHLRKREREAREIVQDILGQMQIGRGDENLTSRITDEISLLSDRAIQLSGIPYKRYRTYTIEIGVNNGNAPATLGRERRDTLEHLNLLKTLANVQNVQYEILYTRRTDADVPAFDTADGSSRQWSVVATASLGLDTAATHVWQNPAYKTVSGLETLRQYAPPMQKNPPLAEPFFYNAAQTDDYARQNNGNINKRFFTVNFQPTQPGWYKLRFSSRTNRIMGLSGDAHSVQEIADDAKISIGAMQLSVRKLRKVQNMLHRELEPFGIPSTEQLTKAQSDDAVREFFAQVERTKAAISNKQSDNPNAMRDLMRKADVYADITKLLTPNKSQYFAQNHGAIEINVRVTAPPIDIVQAQIALPSEVYTFDKLSPAFTFSAGPFYGDNFPQGEIVSADGKAVTLKIERVDGLADASLKSPKITAAAQQGESATFMARSPELIKPGRYTVRMTHSAQGSATTKETVLDVFPSRLTKQSQGLLEARMKSLFFGSALNMTLVPDCQDRIAAHQFRVYAALNNQPTGQFTQGLTAKLPLAANAKSAAVRVTWISPYTGEEVEIQPKLDGTIKQREPEIDLSRAIAPKISGDTETLTIEVSGIVVAPAVVDVGKRGGEGDWAEVSLQQATVEGLPMVLEHATLQETGTTDDGGKTYKAVFTLHGTPSKKPVELMGTLNFTVVASQQNMVNRVRSLAASLPHSLPIEYVTPAKKGKR